MLTRRLVSLALVAFTLFLISVYVRRSQSYASYNSTAQQLRLFVRPPPRYDASFDWSSRKDIFPVQERLELPTSDAVLPIPNIQHRPVAESPEKARVRESRLLEVKSAFLHAWNGYREHAWLQDELAPVSGGAKNTFGGWAATLVDSLDTLWIMGLVEEFEEAVAAVDKIDFTITESKELNVFETTIRYLGGLLAAYDLTEGKYPTLIAKALELGDMLYAAFDTPNRMPITRWLWRRSLETKLGVQEADEHVLVAEIGSLSLEFTRLSQITGDPKFYDAIQRVSDQFERQQNLTQLPGLWPTIVNAKEANFAESSSGFTLGGMADSLYEYLPKQYLLLGGLSEQPKNMYEFAIRTAKEQLFFKPMTKDGRDILISGSAAIDYKGEPHLHHEGQHLTCFAGGMVAIAARIFNLPDDLTIARQLTDGCLWAYENMPSKVMPEIFAALPCNGSEDCAWNETYWREQVIANNDEHDSLGSDHFNHYFDEQVASLKLPLGFTKIIDPRYMLRPEAIESVFILYRILGDESLQEVAWNMFTSISQHSLTSYGNAALFDVRDVPPAQVDSMESFWTAETLKYFYLIFSTPDVVNLDKYVFNTEAHPLKRPSAADLAPKPKPTGVKIQ